MSTEKPENEPSAPPSTPAEPRPEGEAVKAAEPAEAPASPERVLDAGTSQELVIVSYSDDAFLSPRTRALAGEAKSDGAEASAPSDDGPPPSDDLQGLEIVRDVLSLDFISTLRPKEPPPVEREAADQTPAAPATPEAADGSADADPPWKRRPPAGSVAPPPPRAASTTTPRPPSGTTPAPRPPSAAATPRPPSAVAPHPPLPPRPVAAPAATPRPGSTVTVRRAPTADSAAPLAPEVKKPSRELIQNRNVEDLFVKPDFSKSKAPRADAPAAKPPRAASAETPKSPRAASAAAPPPLPPRPTRARPRPDSADVAAPAPVRRPPRPRTEGGAPVVSTIAAVLGSLAFAGACVLAVMHVEPFHTWLYLFAWIPFLLVTNHFTATQSRAHSVFSARARTLGALCVWSIPVWLFFEICNFRLQDWYYVGVPDLWALRRLGVALSFATVLPGIFFLEEMQRVRGSFESLSTRPFPVTPQLEKNLMRIGIACTILILALPTFFFPLVWGVPVLLLEPWLRRRGDTSLLGELEVGRPDRVLRLLVAGMVCGLFWEAANFFAGGRWIYTVPGFSHAKLFEMPLLGFVGFPPFALACWSMARALVQFGLLPDWDAPPKAVRSEAEGEVPAEEARGLLSKGSRISLIAWTVLASLLVLEGMDRWTIDSRTPRPEDVPGIPDGVAQYAHRHGFHDVRGLVTLIDQGRLHVPGASSEQELTALREHCRLVLLRGIGTANARRLEKVGVHTVEDLAARDGSALAKALQGVEAGWTPKPRRVGVWVQAAQHASRKR